MHNILATKQPQEIAIGIGFVIEIEPSLEREDQKHLSGVCLNEKVRVELAVNKGKTVEVVFLFILVRDASTMFLIFHVGQHGPG